MWVPWRQPPGPHIILGTSGRWWYPRAVSFDEHDISQHLHLLGLTNQGKSKFLASYCRQLYDQGIAFCLIDPMGKLADEVLLLLADSGRFPNNRPHQAIRYVDFSRSDAFLPFNVLNQPYPVDRIAENLVEVCLRAWPQLAGGGAPTFERLMRNTIKLLIYSGQPITELSSVLNNRVIRDMSLAQCPDPWVVRFFHESFDHWGREEQRMKESTVNRGDLLTATESLRYSLGQLENALNFRTLLEGQISLIVNLNGLAEQEQRFLGAFIAHGFEKAAYTRGALLGSHAPYILVLDEAPMFTAQSEEALDNVLSRTRQYGLFLVFSHQTISHLSARLLGALQNAALLAFGLGARDAGMIAQDMAEYDPTVVKEGTIGHGAGERVIGSFPGVSEAYQRLKDELKQLHPREVYLKTRFRTEHFRTLHVPSTRTSALDLQAIKDAYARTLMRPRAEVVAMVDSPRTRGAPVLKRSG